VDADPPPLDLEPIPQDHSGSDTDASASGTRSTLSDLSDLSSINLDDSDNEMVTLESSDDEADSRYLRNMALIRDRIKYLTETRVLHPNRVHKLSQLYLVLCDYKGDDHKRFRRNLRVSPSTFDALLPYIQNHLVFMNDGVRDQMPVEHQLAITLYRFGHFGNSASVESIAQWAGCSAGMVVNATRRVMVAFLALHDEVILWPSVS
jgi:hypothetical protein